VSAIVRELGKQGYEQLLVRQVNAVIEGANSIIAECERPTKPSYYGMGRQAWLNCDDTGLSSKYMVRVLSGMEHAYSRFEYAHPRDLDDFGRCSRLLKAVPEFENELLRMSDKSEQWKQLVLRWKEIEALVAEGKTEQANAIVMEIAT